MRDPGGNIRAGSADPAPERLLDLGLGRARDGGSPTIAPGPPLCDGLDETGLAKPGQMMGDAGLGDLEGTHQFPHRA